MMKCKMIVAAAIVLVFGSYAYGQVDTLTILHINDTHSHLLPFGPKDADGNGTWGGMARVATLVGMTRMTDPNVMLFHSGDLFVGDFMFQEYVGVAELEIMKALQYDALELGNHEFDLYPSTLKYVLNESGFPGEGFPVLCANLDITGDPEMAYFVQPYIIREIGGLRIGIFGLLTELTNQISNPAPLSVTPPLGVAQDWVDSLRIGHDCDMVILLSHMGIFEEQVAAATVSGIDVIVGGHTHTLLSAPLQVGNTLIVQAGEFAEYLGKLTIVTDNGAIQNWNYALMPINPSVPEEPNLAGMISYLAAGVEADPRFGPVYTDIIGQAQRDITKALGSGLCKDNPLGNLVADAMREVTGTQIAIQPQGFISQTIYAGPIKGADVFQAVPYGFDQNTGLGLNLVTFETDGMSLIRGLEFATYNLPFVEDFFLHGSNFSYAYNSANAPGSRIDYASIMVAGHPLDPSATYSVVVPDAVIPFFSQIPGFQVSNLTFTGLPLYTVVRDFIAENSPVSYFAEGRVIDLAAFAEPLPGIDALAGAVYIFRENGSFLNAAVGARVQEKLGHVRWALERGQTYSAVVQLEGIESRLRAFIQAGLVTESAGERLIYLTDEFIASLRSGYPKVADNESGQPLPDNFKLSQNYPNPFNPQTEISYNLPVECDVNLAVFDLLGRTVRVLVDSHQSPGVKIVNWDGRDEQGQTVSSGIYFYRLTAGDFIETRKMSLEK